MPRNRPPKNEKILSRWPETTMKTLRQDELPKDFQIAYKEFK